MDIAGCSVMSDLKQKRQKKVIEVSGVKSKKLGFISLLFVTILMLCQISVFAYETGAEVGFAMLYHTVEFDSQGGSSVASLTNVKHGSKIDAPAPPEKAGSEFLGWYESPTGIYRWDFITGIVKSDMKLFARWSASSGSLPAPSVPPASSEEVAPSTPPSASTGGGGGASAQPSAPPTSSRVTAASSSANPAGPGGGGSGTTRPVGTAPSGGVIAPASRSTTPVASGDSRSRNLIGDSGSQPATLSQSAVSLGDSDVPLFGEGAVWALLNLIIAIICFVGSVVMVVGIFIRKQDCKQNVTEETNAPKKRSTLLWRGVAIFVGIMAPIIFMITENMNNILVLTDKWTFLMMTIAIVQLVFFLIAKRVGGSNKETPTIEEFKG